MIRMPIEEIIIKIKERSGKSEEEINSKIKEKMSQLSGLISKEGAAHIVANELGVKIFELTPKVKIEKLVGGMRGIITVGKVLQIYETRDFTSGERSGKIASFLIGDETGTTKVVLWNNQADLLAKITLNDIVRLENTLVKDNSGRKELHINDRSKLSINSEGDSVGEIKRTSVLFKSIKELTENDQNVGIVGTIVQVFEPRFFEVCPQCSKRAKPKETSFVCDTHGAVDPAYSYVMNLFLDDGSENIRVVCFRNQAERLLKRTTDEVLAFKNAPEKFEDVKTELLGNMVKFIGKVSKNQMFERLEFISNNVITEINPEEEIKRLSEKIELQVQ